MCGRRSSIQLTTRVRSTGSSEWEGDPHANTSKCQSTAFPAPTPLLCSKPCPGKCQGSPHCQGPPLVASYLLFQSHVPLLLTPPALVFPEQPRLHHTCPPLLRLVPPRGSFPSHPRPYIRHASLSFQTQLKCHFSVRPPEHPPPPPHPTMHVSALALAPLRLLLPFHCEPLEGRDHGWFFYWSSVPSTWPGTQQVLSEC